MKNQNIVLLSVVYTVSKFEDKKFKNEEEEAAAIYPGTGGHGHHK